MHIGPLVVSKQTFQPCWTCNSQDIPWNSVLQVAVSLQELGECAICLGIPQNPWITLCKHIFCLECLVEHCANSDHPSSAKCPLCLVGLLSREARPVFLFADPLAFIPESTLSSVKLELMMLKPMVVLGEDHNSFLALPAWMHQIDLGLGQFEVHSPLMPFCQAVWISQQEALDFLNAEAEHLSPRVKTFLVAAKKRILEEERLLALKQMKVQKMNFEMHESEEKESEKEDSHVNSSNESINNPNNPRKSKFFYWARAHGGDFFTLHPKAFKHLLLSSHDRPLAPQILAFPMRRESSSNCSSLVEAAENPESLLRKWPPFKHLSCNLPPGSKVIWCDLQQQQQKQQKQQEPKEEYNGQDEYCCSSNTSTILEDHQNLYEMLEGWNGQRREQAVVNLQDEREFPSL